MNVLYYCFEYYCDYGARTHAREFFAALQKHDAVELAVIYPESSPHGPGKAGGVRAMVPNSLKAFLHTWFPQFSKRINYERLKAVIEEKKIDVIVMRAMSDFSLISVLKKDFPGIKLIVEVNAPLFMETEDSSLLCEMNMKVEVKQLRKADALTVVSSHLKSLLQQHGLQGEKILVNQNGVNPDAFKRSESDVSELRKRFRIPEDSFVLGYIGGMESWRKLPLMVTIFLEKLINEHDDLFLVIAGDGPDKSVIKEVMNSKPGCEKHILCRGRVPYDDVPSLAQCFDVALFPFTASYVSPLKLFEYLAMQVPVVGPDVPSVAEIFKDGEHMMLVRQDGNNFCEHVIKLYEDRPLAQRIAMQGKEYVLENYTWENNAGRLVEFIKTF